MESQSAAEVVRLKADTGEAFGAGAVEGRSEGSNGEEGEPGRKGARAGVGEGKKRD